MMQKPANNLTDAPVTLGGVEIEAKGQRVVRESLISDEEKQAIVESGAVIEVKHSGITVSVKGKETVVTGTGDITDVAYPAELIKNDGTLNGSPALKAKIAELNEKYGETILDDKTFAEVHPEADIEAYRVEAGE